VKKLTPRALTLLRELIARGALPWDTADASKTSAMSAMERQAPQNSLKNQ